MILEALQDRQQLIDKISTLACDKTVGLTVNINRLGFVTCSPQSIIITIIYHRNCSITLLPKDSSNERRAISISPESPILVPNSLQTFSRHLPYP